MNRQQKEALVKNLETRFASSSAAFLVNYQGLTVTQMQTLRFALDEQGGTVKVAKNRIAKLALKDLDGCKGLTDDMKGQLAFVFASNEMTSVAKVLADFAKENKALEIVAGCAESHLFDAQAVQRLAALPSREVLLAQLCGVLNGPITSFVMVLRQVIVKYLLTLKAIADKKAKSE